ncbi:MAG: ligase-associated DNA damage response endonuclease PdeM [Chloroflexi bacterium AL-W]|nr:ligase-associated DNA damage response endonuclease PdeM [Chloroflexi bacterium AL-N1]NOK67367.1 ligase-associated DNA damage response endonuclease PdeM [Chloroflexi bacterium AL-N10]NOK75141.1 ligase-associated DNA damage response endonuclease PdeM [Chloroflexi bacterium AL-N5]NOK81928.1 ligase-associated DNA damage response endonuclease PdeM [Chloroflexi bacterium AL-W]NOK89774.1 ligase-associated DNA damage response endonuclease PdeM [Chloroflexi bacterium AL-N15]
MIDCPITIAGEAVTLLPERALFWPRTSTLFVADLHWGKAATFRAHSIAIPEGSTTGDLARLSQTIARTKAQRLVFLGDLLHARAGRTDTTFAPIHTWCEQHTQLEMLLVRGNHDHHAGDPPDEWGITCVDAPSALPPFVLLHQPGNPAKGYGLAGHLHPAVQLTGKGQQRIKLACFWFGSHVGILPAFGSFTGTAVVTPEPADQVYVIADDEVIPVF